MNVSKISLLVIIVALVAALVYVVGVPKQKKDEQRACLQKPTTAKNPKTGEVRDFPDTCIPEGWITVNRDKEAQREIKDETAMWKTYRNEEYDYELKYPNNWVTSDSDGSYIEFGVANPDPKYPGDEVKSYLTLDLICIFATGFEGIETRDERGEVKYGSNTYHYDKVYSANNRLLYTLNLDYPEDWAISHSYNDNSKYFQNHCTDAVFIARSNISDSLLGQILSTFKFTK